MSVHSEDAVVNAREEDFHFRSCGGSKSMLPQNDQQHTCSSSRTVSTSSNKCPLSQHSPVAFSHSPISIHQNYGYSALGQSTHRPLLSVQSPAQAFQSQVMAGSP